MVNNLKRSELVDIAWQQVGVRVSPTATIRDIHDLLQYKIDEEDLPPNPINGMREEIISFIETYRNQLSLPCHGDCYQHLDGIVTFCYRQLIEDTKDAET